MSRIRSTSAFLLLILASALLAVGCGGDDGDSGGSSSGGSDGGAEAEGSSDGGGEAKELFTSTCGGCHTLSDAGTSGTVGPNLDEVAPDAETVRTTIDEGRGAMPADLLEGEEADAVAEYVSSVAGK